MKISLPKIEAMQLVVFVILLVIVGLVAMLGLNIMNGIDDAYPLTCNSGFTLNSTDLKCQNATGYKVAALQSMEYNASASAKGGIENISNQLPNIGLVIAAVVIIGLLITGFAFAFRGGGGNFI